MYFFVNQEKVIEKIKKHRRLGYLQKQSMCLPKPTERGYGGENINHIVFLSPHISTDSNGCKDSQTKICCPDSADNLTGSLLFILIRQQCSDKFIT